MPSISRANRLSFSGEMKGCRVNTPKFFRTNEAYTPQPPPPPAPDEQSVFPSPRHSHCPKRTARAPPATSSPSLSPPSQGTCHPVPALRYVVCGAPFCMTLRQNLGLAGNPIGGVRHLSGLRGLPSLVELALNDVHFGACPVVAADGYRSFIMCSLRQVGRGVGGGGTHFMQSCSCMTINPRIPYNIRT